MFSIRSVLQTGLRSSQHASTPLGTGTFNFVPVNRVSLYRRAQAPPGCFLALALGLLYEWTL